MKITPSQIALLDRTLASARALVPVAGFRVEQNLVRVRECVLDALTQLDAMMPTTSTPRCECPAPCPQHPERNPPKGRT